MKRKELAVEKLDPILIEWLILASTDLRLPTWSLREGHEGYDLPLLCLTIGIRLLLFPGLALALAALRCRRKWECIQSFALLDRCRYLFLVTIHKPAIQVIGFLIAPFVVGVPEHIVPSPFVLLTPFCTAVIRVVKCDVVSRKRLTWFDQP